MSKIEVKVKSVRLKLVMKKKNINFHAIPFDLRIEKDIALFDAHFEQLNRNSVIGINQKEH